MRLLNKLCGNRVILNKLSFTIAQKSRKRILKNVSGKRMIAVLSHISKNQSLLEHFFKILAFFNFLENI
jgi:hypothetical protein